MKCLSFWFGLAFVVCLMLLVSVAAHSQTVKTVTIQVPKSAIDSGQIKVDKDGNLLPLVPAFELSGGFAIVPMTGTTIAFGDTTVVPEGQRLGPWGEAAINLNDVLAVDVQAMETSGKFKGEGGSPRVSSKQVLAGLKFNQREWSDGAVFVPYFSLLTGTNYRPVQLSYTGYSWLLQGEVGLNVFVSKGLGVNVSLAYDKNIRNSYWDQGVVKGGIVYRH